MWSLDTGNPLRFQNQKPDEYYISEISKNDQFAFIARKDAESFLVKLPSLEVLWREPTRCWSVFSPDEKWVAVNFDTESGGAPFILLTETGAALKQFCLSANGRDFTFSHDSRMMAYVDEFKANKNIVKVMDLSTGATISEFELPNGFATLSFSPNGHYFLAGTLNDYQVRVWDLRSNALIFQNAKNDKIWNNVMITNDRVISSSPFAAWDIATGLLLWSHVNEDLFCSDGEYGHDLTAGAIIVGCTGEVVHTFEQAAKAKTWVDLAFYFQFANKVRACLTYAKTDGTEASKVKVWHRRRPEQWWGLAYLPEFWLSILLAFVFLYSLCKPPK